ncbi:hypothetical protein ACFX13_008997 [Malus domestica]
MSRIFVPSATSWSTKHVLIRYHTALGSVRTNTASRLFGTLRMPIRGNSFVKSAIQTLIVAALFITVVGVVTLLTLCAFEEITDTFDDDNADDDDDLIPGQKQWNTADDQRESAAAQQIKHFSHHQHLLVLSDALRDLDCTNYL